MVHIASELTRKKMSIPLLIGGATTSAIHTAVKISPHYSHPIIHVRDASKVIGVAGKLLSAEEKTEFVSDTNAEFERLRQKHASKSEKTDYISLSEARFNKFKPNWENIKISKPNFVGAKTLENINLQDVIEYIDWTFFFHAWKLNGKYPAILKDPIKGEEASRLFNDAQQMLDLMFSESWLTAKAVFGFYNAYADGDDIVVKDDTNKSKTIFHFLRNQEKKSDGTPNLCLSDFIAPDVSDKEDYIGGFVVTAGLGIEEHIKRFTNNNDDYSAIMLKVLADRLAEAATELLHEQVRREYWGYAKDENISIEDSIRERYQGIRPAPGYPACPEHSKKKSCLNSLMLK